MISSSKRPYKSTQLLTIGPVDCEAYAFLLPDTSLNMARKFPVRFSMQFYDKFKILFQKVCLR